MSIETAVRQLGNTALINGIGTFNKSLGTIVMFTALLLAGKKQTIITLSISAE